MDVARLAQEHDWGRITAQLTKFAKSRARRRSWDYARDLAHEAITQFFANPDEWDGKKETLLRHLGHRVLKIATNERQRKGSSFELLMGDATPDAQDDVGSSPDEVLERKEYAEAFRTRLEARLAGDEPALAVILCLLGGEDSVDDQAKATRLTVPQVREARRRIFYHSKLVQEELSRELDEEEVAQ